MLFSKLDSIYSKDLVCKQENRYQRLAGQYKSLFPESELRFFSSPGRTEICGNHTDHNHGKVVAASINLDTIAAVAKTNSNTITLYSEGFSDPFTVNLDFLEVNPKEKETTHALIRGIAARFKELGYQIGGFHAAITSDVLQGSGLSSSASIEVLIGLIFNNLFNEGKLHPEEIAKIGQYAENIYFGKPCGLMDQMACAVGNIISIDFAEPECPVVTHLNFDFSTTGYKLIVLDTGASHADLTDDYASIPAEMKEIAKHFDANFCREIDQEKFLKALPEIHNKYNHRAILRTIHFFNENKRVDAIIETLHKTDIHTFLNIIYDSGNSSFKYLQNIYSTQNIHVQDVSLALALSENFLKKIGDGACRVHGGGFAGTIQLFLPDQEVPDFVNYISPIFGEKSVNVLDIRSVGATEVLL
ncbi:MAG: galactokinase [Candidatus Marinimicrobia bacterium]|nr:galactokinase [Candidatus Neomarinimicrobiota bacterium]